jgi:hypothetical protein
VSDTPLLVFTDDDVRVERGWLTAYAEAATRLGRGHFFCGPNSPDYEQKPPSWLLPYMPSCVAGLQPGQLERRLQPGEFGIGANWAVWREDLKLGGGFNLALGPGPREPLLGEEDHQQSLLVARGIAGVWIPTALIHHWVPADACTPRWMLARQVRQQMTRAWLEPVDPSVPLVFGAPRFLWRVLAEAGLAWMSAFGRAVPEPERFRASLRVASAWGTIRGKRRRTATAQGRGPSFAQRMRPATIPPE